VPFDVVHPLVDQPHGTPIGRLDIDLPSGMPPAPREPLPPGTVTPSLTPKAVHHVDCGPSSDGVTPLGSVAWRQRATVQGRVRTVSVTPISGVPALRAELCDATGGLVLMFYGRRRIQGIEPGAVLRVEGMVGSDGNRLAILNPLYELVRPTDDVE
jgi:hypothetical protein